MLPINPTSLFSPSNPSPLSPLPFTATTSHRCFAAGDFRLGPTFPRWFHFTSAAADAGSIRIGQESDRTASVPPDCSSTSPQRREVGGSGSSGSIRVNAREKKWSRNRESYLADNEDALPLPMTYPDSKPVPPEEIDKRLRCDPEVQDCREVVYEWTGKCRSCQGSGYLLTVQRKQRLHTEMQNISFLEFQYKLSRSKLLRRPSRLFSSRDRQSSSTSRTSTPPTLQPNLSEMRQVFNKFDSNKDGKISQQEYKATLRALGQENMIGEVPKIFQVVDMDGDGFIDFTEFVEAQKKGGGIKTTDIQGAFQAFDVNGDGKITAEELMEVLRCLGESCSLEDCRRMVRAVDADGDGMVNMDEFETMMTKTFINRE
ncbi:hypothetical protein GH714_035360 [Hevea brasiliensis]|uniref:EF-hand domain-containing protein n=2 Tax=Hevea brasiliensis TaxID=3981 RepID=A0A6A6N6B8_HEVBR|nr:hypothetical protein GH714_035360 [Hevea brasiliensis]